MEEAGPSGRDEPSPHTYTLTDEKTGKKRRFYNEENLSGVEVTNLKVKKSEEQQLSQEVVLTEIQTEFIKPFYVPSLTGEYHIVDTPLTCCDWAEPSYMLARELTKSGSARKVKKGAFETSLRAWYGQKPGKSAVKILTEEDREEIIELVREGGAAGLVIREGGAGGVRVGLHQTGLLCVLLPREDKEGYRYQVICKDPNCLSMAGTRLDSPFCKNHKGVTAYAVVEITHELDSVIAIYSTVFGFSTEDDATPERERKLIELSLTNIVCGGSKGTTGWKDYKTALPPPVKYNIFTSAIFRDPKKGERHLAMIQTARFFAKLGGGLIDGKEFRILNKNINLAYKNETEMEKFLRVDCGISMSCKTRLIATPFPLPQQLGRRATNNLDIPQDGEKEIYMKCDINVNYSGEKLGEDDQVGTTNVAAYNPLNLYQQTQSNANVKAHRLLIVDEGFLSQAEQIVNISNYIGHLYKLTNQFTGSDYICVNKQVKVSLLLDNWDLVQGFCSYFYDVDVDLSPNVE